MLTVNLMCFFPKKRGLLKGKASQNVPPKSGGHSILQLIIFHNPTHQIPTTVDGSEIRRSPVEMVVYPIIHKVLNIPDGAG